MAINKPSVLIIGYGMVGTNLHKEFDWADIHDPIKGYLQETTKKWDYAFVCVPTDMLEDGSADISIVRSVLREFKDRVGLFIIKSTIPPGTTERFNEDTALPDRIVFSPEYYGVGPHSQEIPPMNFVILGGVSKDTEKAAQIYTIRHSAFYRITQTSARAAELTKYMENCWLANQVTFVNEFYRIAQQFNINYVELRELFLHDSRMSPANTYVYPQAPYWDSHCYNKDIPAIIQASVEAGYTPEYLKAMIDVNSKFKREKFGD